MADNFRFTIPGQPPSWNHSYGFKSRPVLDGNGQPRLNAVGNAMVRPQQYKKKGIKDYQEEVGRLARQARPRTFQPEGQVIIGYQFYLGRPMDCDNIMKAVNDAIAAAIGINDSRFWPVTLHKQTGCKDPRVVILVFDGQFWFPTISANTPEAEIAV